MSPIKRINRADTATEQELEKIKKKHDKQLNRMYSQDEWIFAIIAYVGPLFVFPLLMRQSSNFCQYHARQGMVLFGTEIILWVGSLLPLVGVIFKLATLLVFVAGLILGVMNVIKEKEEPIPFIGKYAEPPTDNSL